MLISIAAQPDAYVSIAVRPDVDVELLFPFKFVSSTAIIFIGADAAEDALTTVVLGRATFDVSLGRDGSGSGGGSGGMGGLPLLGEANAAIYSSATEVIVDNILHLI